jgi:two-component system sensor histidine kinase RpfC
VKLDISTARPSRRGRGLRAWWAWGRRRLKSRPDSEHEMTLNRLAFAGIVVIWLLVGDHLGNADSTRMLELTETVFAVYFALSLAIFAHILWRPGENVARRIVAMVHDFSMISYAAWAGGAATGFFYPLYLWTVFGNGFRFGVPYLFVAMGISIAGFSAAIGFGGYVSDHVGLSVALLLGLVILPVYASVLIRKLSEAKRTAEAANRAKSLFLASVSHELRTPLNAIIGFSDLLSKRPLGRQEAEMVRTVAASGRSLLTLINGLLDYSRLEAGRMPSSANAFDLDALTSRVAAMLSVAASEKGLRLGVHVGVGVPRLVVGDERHLEEILVNLASNAVKFTRTGHVLIAVETADEAGEGGRRRLRFDVADTGIGIAPEAQARIFESFTQADETIIDRFGGTGLGLAIVKQLVELLGGTINLRSAAGRGSTFSFVVPLDVPEQPDLPAPDGEEILLLTADADIAAETMAVLPGLRVAADAEAATTLLVAAADQGRRIALVLLDETLAAADAGGVPAEVADRLAAAVSPPPAISLFGDGDGDPAPLDDSLRCRILHRLSRPVDVASVARVVRLAAGAHETDRGTGADGPLSPGRRLRPLRVLIAEDNKTNQMVLGKLLETAGHVSLAVDHGEAALEMLRDQGFDVVLMDVNMPVMNGIEATKLYRFMSLGRPRIPIVGLTADATPEARERCLSAGMDACATKPIDVDQLLDVIASVLGEATAPAAEGPREAQARVAAFARSGAVLDPDKLDDLERLGGPAFVRELVGEFLGETETLVRDLADAVADEDVTAFRDAAHALRSAAANVGAEAIFELCLSWRQIEAAEVAGEGEHHVRALVEALEQARSALEARTRPAPGRAGAGRV